MVMFSERPSHNEGEKMSDSNVTDLTVMRPPAGEKAQSTADMIYEKLRSIVEEIVILRVTTVVGEITASDIGDVRKPTIVTVAPQGQVVAQASINTALGNMDVTMSKGFLEDAKLVALHMQSLADARAIRKDTIEMLRSAISMVTGSGGAGGGSAGSGSAKT